MGGCQSHNFPIDSPGEGGGFFRPQPKPYTVNCSVDDNYDYIISNGVKVQLFKNNFWDKKVNSLKENQENNDPLSQSAIILGNQGQETEKQLDSNRTIRKKSAGFVTRKRSTMSAHGGQAQSSCSNNPTEVIQNINGLIITKSPKKQLQNIVMGGQNNGNNINQNNRRQKNKDNVNQSLLDEGDSILQSLQSCSSTVSMVNSKKLRPATPSKGKNYKIVQSKNNNKPVKILNNFNNLNERVQTEGMYSDFDNISFIKDSRIENLFGGDSSKNLLDQQQQKILRPPSCQRKRTVRASSLQQQTTSSKVDQQYQALEQSMLNNESFVSQKNSSFQRPQTPSKGKINIVKQQQQQQFNNIKQISRLPQNLQKNNNSNDPWSNIQSVNKGVSNLNKTEVLRPLNLQQSNNLKQQQIMQLQQQQQIKMKILQQKQQQNQQQQGDLRQLSQTQQALNPRNFSGQQQRPQSIDDNRKQLQEQIQQKKLENAQKLKELRERKMSKEKGVARKNVNQKLEKLENEPIFKNPVKSHSVQQQQQNQLKQQHQFQQQQKQQLQTSQNNLLKVVQDENAELCFKSPQKRIGKLPQPQKIQQKKWVKILDSNTLNYYLAENYEKIDEFEKEKQEQEILRKKCLLFQKDLIFCKDFDNKKLNFFYKLGTCNLKELYDTRVKYQIKWQNRDQDLTYVFYNMVVSVYWMWKKGVYFQDISMENIWFLVNKKEELHMKFYVQNSKFLSLNGSIANIDRSQVLYKNEFERLQGDLQQVGKIVLKIMISTYGQDSLVQSEEDLMKNYCNLEVLEKQFQIFNQDYLKKFLLFLQNILTKNFELNFIEQWVEENQEKLKPIVDKTNNTWKKALEDQQKKPGEKYSLTQLLLQLDLIQQFQLQDDSKLVEKIIEKQNEADEEDEQVILIRIGHYYFNKSKYGKSKQYFQNALPILEKLFGKNSLQYVEILRNLGQVNKQMSNYKESEGQFLECENIYGEILDKKYSVKLAQIYEELGYLYMDQGEIQKCEKAFLSQVQIYENLEERQKKYKVHQQQKNNYSKKIMKIYNVLGTMLQNMEDMETQAEKYFNKCLQIQKNKAQVSVEESQEIAVTLQNLGMISEQKGQFQKAEKLYLETVAIVERVCSGQKLAQFYQNLGRVYFSMNQPEKSDIWYKKTHSLYLQQF